MLILSVNFLVVHRRRSCLLLRSAQHFRAHLHVRLLHAGRHGPRVPEVRLVEAAHDHPADGSVRWDHDSRISVGESVFQLANC